MPEPRPDLAAIRERLEKITPWPWQPMSHLAGVCHRVKGPPTTRLPKCEGGGSHFSREADAVFIANTPADVAALVARVEELEAALREIAKRDGPYKRDHLAHAESVVENMATIAERALAAAQEETR